MSRKPEEASCRLTIDGREIVVAADTPVIDAAERLGIMIPRFCYHPALGAVGACRMCAVKFLDGPVKGLQMSCMVGARDGMVVSTTNPEAVDFRRQVVEWLMANHPHDCPVCDEGGHCLLQDETISGGHALRRYRGPKRTYRDQDLGPFVKHEMNRCIHCYRCARFYQEVAGGRDYGVLSIARRTYFGRYEGGRLESPFAGNIIDLCPTGTLTDKPSRYRARRWDLERGPSVCLHCSLGCGLTVGARYREVMKLEARLNPEVNGHFICDRGRYGFGYESRPDRPRQPRVDGRETIAGAALAALAEGLKPFEAGKVAMVGGTRSNLETLAALLGLCRDQGWRPPVFFRDARLAGAAESAAAALSGDLAASLADVGRADVILVVCADPLAEAPMLALSLRRAERRGAAVLVLDHRPCDLPCEAERLTFAPEELAGCLSRLAQAALRGRKEAAAYLSSLPLPPDLLPETALALDTWGKRLAEARFPLVVCGTDQAEPALPALAGGLARLLAGSPDQDRRAGFLPLLPGPNGLAAALAGGGDLEALLADIEDGRVTALLVVESDLLSRTPEPERWLAALRKLKLLAVCDHLPSPLLEAAHVVLPSRTVFEAGGHFVNQEGRLQRAMPVFSPGLPMGRTLREGHPPRLFMSCAPGSEPRPAADWLKDLAGLLGAGGRAGDWADLAAAFPGLPGLAAGPAPENGRRCLPDTAPGADAPSVAKTGSPDVPPDHLQVLLVERTFGTEELSCRAPLLAASAPEPWIDLAAADAGKAGLAHGAWLLVPLPGGPLRARLRVHQDMAPGLLLLPRDPRLLWQRLAGTGVLVELLRLHAITAEEEPAGEDTTLEAEP
jgi:NADH-quinone oxidoreductase subunit G